MDFYPERFVPWHWHSAVELFYMESGSLEYSTPQGKAVFPQGSGGFVNSNVLHMTRPLGPVGKNVQLVHLFDPGLIAGPPGSRIGQKYVLPLAAAQKVELAALRPGDPAQEALLERVRAAFCLSEQESGYEIRLRSALSEIWLGLFELLRPRLEEPARPGRSSEKLKALMAYIHEHYGGAGGLGLPQRAGVLPPVPRLPAHHPGGLHPVVPPAGGLPDAGPERNVSDRDRAGQRPGQQQLFRQAVPGGDGLHPLRVPPQMAGSC